MMDWEAVRHFLAVARCGNLSAAARRIGVSQPTMGRRIEELETQLNARLFDRLKQGFALTPAGHGILELAESMERTAVAMELRVRDDRAMAGGRVVVCTTECLAISWLVPRLPRFAECFPAIEVELVVGIGLVDLLRGEAEVALRVGMPGSDHLVGRRIGAVAFGLFASQPYLERFGEPRSLRELAGHRIIESTGEISELTQVRRLRGIAGDAAVVLRCNSLITQLQAVRQGMGLIAAPAYAAAGLRRVLAEDFHVQLDLWVVTHRDLRTSARVRAIMDFLAEQARGDAHLLGTGSHASAA